jgi:hypothetical protein
MISTAAVTTGIGIFQPTELSAAPKGKIDAGPIYLDADVELHGETIKTMEMLGFSATGTILFCHDLGLDTRLLDGLCLKPRFLIAGGEGDLWNAGIGLGYYIPLSSCFTVIPNAGVTWGELEVKDIDIPADPSIPAPAFLGSSQKFKSTSPYMGIDLSLTQGSWMFNGMIQYAWSATKTYTNTVAFGNFFSDTESKGFNYAAQVDYYFTDCWSVNAAIAHNTSRSKERNGLKITGGRLGLGYTF